MKEKTYKITITIVDGDRIEAAVLAANQSNAIVRLMKTQIFSDFVNNREIKDVEVSVSNENNDAAERFVLQKSEKENNYVLTDTKNLVSIKFQHGDFNGTQKITDIFGKTEKMSASNVARILREAGEWLHINHYEKAFSDIFAKRIAFCKKIIEMRRQQGLTQKDLASRVNCKQQHIARIELGKVSPGLDLLIQIAIALKTKIDFV